jgi:hypothetical protein
MERDGVALLRGHALPVGPVASLDKPLPTIPLRCA